MNIDEVTEDKVFEFLKGKTDNLQPGQRIKINKDFLQFVLPLILKKLKNKAPDVLKKIDMSEICFDDIDVRNVVFFETNANIDPQTVYAKSLFGTNLTDVDMSRKCFDGVFIVRANLTNTNSNIDPQKVFCKLLCGTNLTNVDMSDKCFDEVDVSGAIITNINTNVRKSLLKTILKRR